MKKFILAAVAVATLAVPAVASADVPASPGADREPAPVEQPRRGSVGQFGRRVEARLQGHGQPVRRHVHRERQRDGRRERLGRLDREDHRLVR